MQLNNICFGLLAFLPSSLTQTGYNVSAPFNLLLTSPDGQYNNSLLGLCHAGAALSNPCGGGVNNTGGTFLFNTTFHATSGFPGNTPAGILTIPFSSDPTYPTMGLGTKSQDPDLNLISFQLGLYGPFFETAFDGNDLMNVVDCAPEVGPDGKVVPCKLLYHWYMCDVLSEGGLGPELSWVVGNDEPDDSSCVKVDVKRSFVNSTTSAI